VDSGDEIIPGIKAIEAAGHTPGQMALSISSQGESLLYLSDVIIHPLHLMEPEWYSMVDILPQKVASTRRVILQQASLAKNLVMAFHFPFPGLGFIMPGEQAWKWKPLTT
jgi:glyoxylase-like metal-dependent hydrolase (beta-lactamase superfamily II)